MQDERERRHFSMLRSFAAADFLTLANASCGMAAIFCCLRYAETQQPVLIWVAFGLFPLALIFDILDGWVARWRRRHSALGADLDSLADIVSFGVAPAVLGYTLGMTGILDGAVLTFFVICGIARLARFNVTASQMTGDQRVKYFEGAPVPTSVLVVLVLVVAYMTGNVHEELWGGTLHVGPWRLHPLVLIYGVSGSAMISATLRFPRP